MAVSILVVTFVVSAIAIFNSNSIAQATNNLWRCSIKNFERNLPILIGEGIAPREF